MGLPPNPSTCRFRPGPGSSSHCDQAPSPYSPLGRALTGHMAVGGGDWGPAGGSLRTLQVPRLLGPVAGGALEPGVIDGRGNRRGHGAGANVPDDVEGLLERMVHAQHVVPPLGLVGRLLHEAALVR